MDNEEIKHLLIKYITGEANEVETAKVGQWINAHPENELYFVELYEAWQNTLYLKPDFADPEKEYKRFIKKVEGPKMVPNRWNNWYKLAAVITLFITISLITVTRYRQRIITSPSQIAVNKGTIKKVILSDGTKIWLNASSTLKYDADFGKANRSVYLDGEAFFDIAPGHKNIPFVVYTKNYIIRDIGTKFNLKSYAVDPVFEAAVIRGEIAVEPKSNGGTETNRIFLKPHQVLKIQSNPAPKASANGAAAGVQVLNDVQIQQVTETQLAQYEGWKDNELVFENKPLGEIIPVLERRYDVSIQMSDSELQNIRYTGCFKNVQSIDKVLTIIKETTPVQYTIKDNNIVITKSN